MRDRRLASRGDRHEKEQVAYRKTVSMMQLCRTTAALPDRPGVRDLDVTPHRLETCDDSSVSNSLSGRHWELDQVPAVGDPTHMVQLGSGQRVSAGEGQRRVALQ